MEAANAVVSNGEIAESDVVDRMANVAAKSLVVADVDGATVITGYLSPHAPTRSMSSRKAIFVSD
jgi:hypothetical protein